MLLVVLELLGLLWLVLELRLTLTSIRTRSGSELERDSAPVDKHNVREITVLGSFAFPDVVEVCTVCWGTVTVIKPTASAENVSTVDVIYDIRPSRWRLTHWDGMTTGMAAILTLLQ